MYTNLVLGYPDSLYHVWDLSVLLYTIMHQGMRIYGNAYIQVEFVGDNERE